MQNLNPRHLIVIFFRKKKCSCLKLTFVNQVTWLVKVFVTRLEARFTVTLWQKTCASDLLCSTVSQKAHTFVTLLPMLFDHLVSLRSF